VKVSTLLVASLAGEASRVALASSHADSPVGWSKLSRMAARAVDKTSGLIPGRSGGKTKDSEKGALLKSLQDLVRWLLLDCVLFLFVKRPTSKMR